MVKLLESFIKFGRCVVQVYPFHLKIYTSKGKDGNNSIPLGSRVVHKMEDVLKENSDPINYEIYFNNLFTGLVHIADESLKPIGTVRKNRTQRANKKLKDVETMKTFTRGEFDYCCDGNVYFCR